MPGGDTSTLEIVLIAAVVVLAVAPLASLRSRRRAVRTHGEEVAARQGRATEAHTRAERQETQLHHKRADATEELAQESSARQRLEAELHEARARITELEGGGGERREKAGLFRRDGRGRPGRMFDGGRAAPRAILGTP